MKNPVNPLILLILVQTMAQTTALIFIMLFFAGCETYDKNKPTKFFKIKEGWSDEARKHKYEDFVISNPPNDSSLLRKIIEEHNFRTIKTDTIKKYFPYERTFYRETKCLTRNYMEGMPYPAGCGGFYYVESGQSTGDHFDDKLMSIFYYSHSDSNVSYGYIFGKDFDFSSKKRKIENIDLFFEENRKKLNK